MDSYEFPTNTTSSTSPPLLKPRPFRPGIERSSSSPSHSSVLSLTDTPYPRWDPTDDKTPNSLHSVNGSSSSTNLNESTLSGIYAPLTNRASERQQRYKWRRHWSGDEDDDNAVDSSSEDGEAEDEDDDGVEPGLHVTNNQPHLYPPRIVAPFPSAPAVYSPKTRRSTFSTSKPTSSFSMQDRRRSSTASSNRPELQQRVPRSTFGFILALASRVLLLFAIGTGYGALMRHLLDKPDVEAGHDDGARNNVESGWMYLIGWGIAGVGLGTLVPLVDEWWAGASDLQATKEPEGNKSGRVDGAAAELVTAPQEEDIGEEVDGIGALRQQWYDVVRSVGAFIGVAFAIRKTPWQSTHQLSLTLALANPALWYLLDRSRPGLALAALIGVAGTAALFAMHCEQVVPLPASWPGLSSSSSGGIGEAYGGGVVGYGHHKYNNYRGNGSLSVNGGSGGATGGGAVPSAGETGEGHGGSWTDVGWVESIGVATWVASVLFCTCVCFGNIGRRLALSEGIGVRGYRRLRRGST